MNWGEQLKKQRDLWLSKRMCLSKQEIAYISGKDTTKGKLLDLFSARYFKRSELIKKSEVFYGYVFKDYRPQFDADFYFPTWVLHSPSEEVNLHPEILGKVASNLSNYVLENKRKETLFLALTDNLYQTAFLKIPEDLAEGKLIYLSIVYLRRSNMTEPRFGLNFFLANQSVSRELLYLPSSLWTKEWGAYYRNENKE